MKVRVLSAIIMLLLFVPLLIIGIALVYNADKMLNEYYMELLETENSKVRNIFTQITTQGYSISNEICFDNAQKTLLSKEYETKLDFIDYVNANSQLDEIF